MDLINRSANKIPHVLLLSTIRPINNPNDKRTKNPVEIIKTCSNCVLLAQNPDIFGWFAKLL